MTAPAGRPRPTHRGLLTAAVAVVLLAAGSTVAAAAATGGFESTSPGPAAGSGPACAAPALPGTTVTIRLVDAASMMRPGAMMGGSGSMMGQGDRRYFHRGMMLVLTSATSAPAGTVSFAVVNDGRLTHELVVLPLAAGRVPGTRTVGSDGIVDEAASLGEASATCAAGEGNGIAAGSTGWVTLRLPAGRYELVCNLPGHYAAGMYAELDVG